MATKPILFNTDMVRALLDGRKTVTRRVVKYTANDVYDAACVNLLWNEAYDPKNPPGGLIALYVKHMKKSPYQSGDILYVRETWTELCHVDEGGTTHYDQTMFFYAADGNPGITLIDADGFELDDQRVKWRPSIHMPKEAARIFLRVTDVRVEQLQDIDKWGAAREGQPSCSGLTLCGGTAGCPMCEAELENAVRWFSAMWDKIIKPADHALYSWDANPWVWVIEFERINKEEALRNE